MTTPERPTGLDSLLPVDQRSGDIDDDLFAALAESFRRRENNSEDGGEVIAALRARGWSWRAMEKRGKEMHEGKNKFAQSTLRRWADAPDGTDENEASAD